MWKHTRIQKTVYARLVNVIEELEYLGSNRV
jgi:hypothetical protein